MKKGFYTALGTPTDENGNVCEASMAEQIEQQIQAGASGLLVMGSMGKMTYLKNSAYPKVAEVSAKVAKGRVPVLVGVTDVSIGRVKDRIDAIAGIDGIDGVVSTVPYYSTVNQDEIYNFYNGIADYSKVPVYLYDLAVVTKAPTLPATVQKLWKNPNIKGIKSGNMITHRLLRRMEDRPADFDMMFSNIDEFDIAYKYGIDKNLDGMFACTPKNAKIMYEALAADDMATASDALDRILGLRNMFLTTPNLMNAFTHAMNLIGCEGCFSADYTVQLNDADKDRVKEFMKQIGEI